MQEKNQIIWNTITKEKNVRNDQIKSNRNRRKTKSLQNASALNKIE